MKKFLVVALSALMLLALFIPAMADTAPVFTTSVSKAKVKPGEEVTVTVTLDKTIASLKTIALDYSKVCDPDVFEWVSGDFSAGVKAKLPVAQANPGTQAVCMNLVPATDVSGEIFSFTVKAKADAALGTYDFKVVVKVDSVEQALAGTKVEIYHDCVFSNDYSKDENGHWKACTLGCGKKSDEGNHNFGGTCGGTCTVCGYTRPVEHNYNVQKSDATHHWNQCACGAVDETSKTEHAGGTATCKEKAVCATCGTAYGEFGAHGATNDVKESDADCKNPAQYKKVCSVCGEQVGASFPVGEADPSKHTGGKATCKDKATCTYCGQPYGSVDPDNHTGNNTVTPAEPASCTKEGKTKEVKCNDCGVVTTPSEVIPKTAHSGGTATCKEAAKCAACGTSYGAKDPANHTGNNTVTPAEPASCTKEGKTQEVKCNDCGVVTTPSEVIPKTAHSGGTATCKEAAKCAACGASYGEKDPTKHTGNNTVTPAEPATCTKEGKTEEVKCNDCGQIVTPSQPVAKAPHTPGQDNKCTVCGETVKPSTTTKNPNIPQNGDSSNVVLFVTLSIISVLTLGAIVITKRARASK